MLHYDSGKKKFTFENTSHFWRFGMSSVCLAVLDLDKPRVAAPTSNEFNGYLLSAIQ